MAVTSENSCKMTKKGSYRQFLPKISSRVYSVNSRKLSEANICTQSKINVSFHVKSVSYPAACYK